MNDIYEFIQGDLKNNRIPENLATKKNLKNLFNYAQKNRLVSRVSSRIYNQELYKINPDIPHKNYYLSSKSRYLELVKEIFQLNRLLKENNIEPIFLKGAYFYLLGIDKPEERFMADIDILLKQEMLSKAIKVLLKNNYNFKRFKNFNNIDINENWTHQTPVIISPNGYAIDVHHRVTSPRNIKGTCILTKEIFNKKEYIHKYNSRFAIPQPQHCICHLAYNSVHHDMCSSGPSIFYDIRDLITYIEKSKKIDQVNAFIKTYQNNKSINITLAMCKKIGINVPFDFKTPPKNIVNQSMDMIFMGKRLSILNKKFSLNRISYRLKNSTYTKYLKSDYKIENIYRFSEVLISKLIDFIGYSFFIMLKPNLYKTHKLLKKYVSNK